MLSFGGPPTFEPSAWEWAFRAAPLMRTDPSEPGRSSSEGLAAPARSAATLHYNLACLEAIQGDRDAAISELRTAIAVRSEAADWARSDDDFASLCDDQEFRGLVGPG